jgi:tetratricopeptide (TPR) repeat protein
VVVKSPIVFCLVVVLALSTTVAFIPDALGEAPSPLSNKAPKMRTEAMESLQKGRDFKAKGQSKEAMAAFQKAIALFPAYPLAHNELGVFWVEQGDLDKAQHHFKKATYWDPDFSDAWANQAETERRAGRHEEAFHAYGQALRVAPEDSDAWHGIGASLIAQKRLGEALFSLETYIEVSPPGHPRREAVETTILSLLDRAVDAKEFELPQRPDDPAPLVTKPEQPAFPVHKGDAAFRSRRYMQALEAYEAELKTKAKDAVLHYKIGATLAVLGDTGRAIDAWRRALLLNASSEVLLQRMHQASRLSSMKDSLAVGPKTTAPLKAAQEALNAGNPALAYIRTSTSKNSNALFIRGEAALRLGRYNDAKKAFEKALALDPDHHPALGGLAETLWRLGEDEKAKKLTEKWASDPSLRPERFFVVRKSETEQVISADD